MNQSNWKRVFLCTHLFLILTKFLSASVHVASKNKKRKNDAIICYERLSSIFEKTLTKNIFFLKNTAVFWKKTLNVWNEKTFASWWNKRKISNILLSLHHINFTDVKKEIYLKILLNFCETFFNVVLGCPFRGTCLQPVSRFRRNFLKKTILWIWGYLLHT